MKTEHGHELVELASANSNLDLSEHYPIRYNRSEYNFQIEKMKNLGINVDAQTFEQCVNTLIFMIENRLHSLK